jgi:hypothetical protein
MIKLILLALTLLPVMGAPQSAPPRTVLDGVYTAVQAGRGETAYQAHCASCHKDDLTGLHASALKGNFFMDRWREFKLDVLYNTISTTMPRGAPNSLDDQVYLDLLAYLLKANEVPAGASELTADVVRNTLLVGKDGPQPLPTSTPVDVVGCLAQISGSWILVRASEPARTMNQWELTIEDTNEAKARPLGDLRFRLQDAADASGFNAETLVNNRVEVKGLLVRQPNNERVNVSAIQLLAPGCE